MSEEAKKTAPAQEAEQPETAPEEKAQQAAPEQEPAAEAADPKDDKKKDGGWFNKKAREMEAVKAKLDVAEQNAAQAKEQLLRMAAEYDNYRKRTAKEKDNLYQDAKADTIKEFLAVYDNLERAVATEGDEDSPHKKGLEMIFHQYQEILKKLGVTEIEAQGQPFDPEKHNAVMHIDDENLGENVVSQVFQAGFLLGDKVIRHAIVQVAN